MTPSVILRLTRLVTVIIIFFIFSLTEVSSFTEKSKNNENKYVIMIDVSAKQLSVFDKQLQKVIKIYPIATGRKDTPSPLGTWVITDKGRKEKPYFGTRWMGLNVPWGGYGIHGTNNPGSIGSALSNGCFRMHNKHVEELYDYIPVGTTVIIEKGSYGPFGDGFRVLKPGDFGSDVYEVQRLMKSHGYFPGALNGTYKQDMVPYVIKFRKNNNLEVSSDIDSKFYKALGAKLSEYYMDN